MGLNRNIALYTKIGNLLFNFNYIDSKYKIGAPDDCWEWFGATHRQGYGMCGYINATTEKRHMTVVHRPLMMRHLGRELSHDEFVIKTCSNEKCCNPAHYIVGDHQTKSENMYANDRQAKNIQKEAGITRKQNRRYKYDEATIAWVRDAETADIAQRFNIGLIQAGQLRWGMRKNFKWLPWPNRPKEMK